MNKKILLTSITLTACVKNSSAQNSYGNHNNQTAPTNTTRYGLNTGRYPNGKYPEQELQSL